MIATSVVPVSVASDVSAQLAELGLEGEFQQILDYTQEAIKDMHSLEVTLEYPPDEPGNPTILLHAHRPVPSVDFDKVDGDWGQWLVTTFPPDVALNFCLLSFYHENSDGR